MNSTKAFAGAAVAALLSLAPLAAHANAVLTNPQDGGSIGPLGNTGLPDILGEVFTAPVTGTLSSFTLTFNGVPDSFQAGIGAWNGPATWTPGFGVTSVDYETAAQNGVATGDFTFHPDIAVEAGQQYVAFVSTFGLTDNPDGTNGLLLSQTPTSGIDYIVYNYGSPSTNPWDYNFNYQGLDFAITAHFTTPQICNSDHPCDVNGGPPGVPEPSAWALMILGFGATGAALRRRHTVVAA